MPILEPRRLAVDLLPHPSDAHRSLDIPMHLPELRARLLGAGWLLLVASVALAQVRDASRTIKRLLAEVAYSQDTVTPTLRAKTFNFTTNYDQSRQIPACSQVTVHYSSLDASTSSAPYSVLVYPNGYRAAVYSARGESSSTFAMEYPEVSFAGSAERTPKLTSLRPRAPRSGSA